MIRKIKFFLLVVFGLAFVVFAVANRAAVEISLFPLPYSATMPLFLLVMACFALGIVFAWLLLGARSYKSRRLYNAEHKRVMALQNEIEGVKATHSTTASLVNH